MSAEHNGLNILILQNKSTDAKFEFHPLGLT